MSSPTSPADLLDIKMLPAWANEPARPNEYANFEGEEFSERDHRSRGPRTDRQPRRPRPTGGRRPEDRARKRSGDGFRRDERRPAGRHVDRPREVLPLPAVDVRFVPHPRALESVIEQIKSGSVAYSVFALARLFLEKPERYDVRLTGTAEVPLHQLGEHGSVAVDRGVLESKAFAAAIEEFFVVETTQTEPLKGNFGNVARCRLSGTLLGPTNYHSYQPQLRSLYEQRFSRRMTFPDYQRQIEIISDPAVIEQWKEQARNVTKYTTKKEEAPVTFDSAADAERFFRQKYLPDLVRTATEVSIDGVTSRQLADRGLRRVIEEAWVRETRSPSKMMQELAGGLRQAGLNIFRHRRGMLFVSPIRPRTFDHDRTSVSQSINAVLDKVTATPGIHRKQLAAELAPAGEDAEAAERAKLALVSDLRWLVSEGYLIEFNDGACDLPRTRKPVEPVAQRVAASAEPIAGQPDNAAEPTIDASTPAPADANAEADVASA